MTSTIPKDRQIIIEHKKSTNVAIWSKADGLFVYANVQTDMYEGEWNMLYFDNEYIKEEDILSWKELS